MINISVDSKEYKYYGITELEGYQMGLRLAIDTNDTNLQEFFERKIESYERKIANRRKASQEKRRVKLGCVYKAFKLALGRKIGNNELPMVTLEEIQDASDFPLSTNAIAYYLNIMDNEEEFIEQQSLSSTGSPVLEITHSSSSFFSTL